jgi:hypothetical protein
MYVKASVKYIQDDYKSKALAEAAEVQVQLAMVDFYVALQDPSSIACSSIILAMNSVSGYTEFDDETISKWVDELQLDQNTCFYGRESSEES